MSSIAGTPSTAANGRPSAKMPTIDLELEKRLASFNQVVLHIHVSLKKFICTVGVYSELVTVVAPASDTHI